jgi:hypothetical protein
MLLFLLPLTSSWDTTQCHCSPPPHLDLGHDLVLHPFVLWDVTSCCVPSHLVVGCNSCCVPLCIILGRETMVPSLCTSFQEPGMQRNMMLLFPSSSPRFGMQPCVASLHASFWDVTQCCRSSAPRSGSLGCNATRCHCPPPPHHVWVPGMCHSVASLCASFWDATGCLGSRDIVVVVLYCSQ